MRPLRPLLSVVLVLLLLGGTDIRGQLRTAYELRSLSTEEAEEGVPVDLRGVVVFADSPGTVFFQDETAGVFFQLQGRTPPAPGDEIRVIE